MMTNLLHGAHVANKLFSTIARLRLLFVMFVALTVTTNAWGADVTWNFESSDTELGNLSKDPISVSYAKNSGTNSVAISSSAFRLYKGSNSSTNGCSVTFTIASEYKIESITVVFKDGRTSARGKIDNGSYEDVFSAGNSKTVTISSLSAQSYSIQNQGSSTVAITSITITYSSNTSTPAVPHTVKFYKTSTTFESRTEESAGDGVTPPTMEEECGDWTFQGWSESFSVSETSTTKLDLVTLDEGIYYPTEDVNLYPVYTKSEGGGGSTEEALSQTLQYDTWSYGGSTTDKSSYRLFHSGSYIESAEFDLSTLSKVIVYGGTFGGSSYNKLTIAGLVGNKTTPWKSVTVSGSSQTGVNTYTEGTSLSGTGKLRVTSNSGSSSNTGVRISKIMIYTLQATSTTYYYSYPSCATEPTVTLNPNGGTFAPTPNGWTPDEGKLTKEVDGSVTLPTPTHDGCYDFAGWYDAQTGGNEIDADAYTPTEDIELFAHWTESTTSFIAMIDDENIPTVEGFAIEIGLNEDGTGKVTDGVETTCGNNVYLFRTLVQGYKEVQWTVTIDETQETIAVQNDGDVPYFVMPKADVFVSAELIECDEMDAPDVTATSTHNSITLSWDPITGAKEYNVFIFYDYGNSHLQDDANLVENETSYTFTNLDAEHTYTYIVQAQTEIGTCFTETMGEITTASATCTVTYNANDGIGTPPSDETEYTNGATVTVLGNYGKLTKDGYAFTGWNTKADGTGTPYEAGETFTISDNTPLYAQWCEAHWALVTSTSEIENDTRIVIAAKDEAVALSTTQNETNRGQATIEKKYNTIKFDVNTQILSLVDVTNNKFTLYTGSGYLYAASSSTNQLKTDTKLNDNYKWSIAISQGAAIILAQGTNTNNQLKYNSTSDLFSCYGTTTSQKDVVIYKEVCVQDQYNVNEPELTNATAANTNPTTVDADATSLTLNYSANTGHLLPETITVKMGGALLVATTDYTWDKATGVLTINVKGFYGDIDVKIVAEEDPCFQFEMSEVTATSTTSNSVTLTWTEVTGATGYNVKLGTGEFTAATGLTHTFEGLTPKTTYNWEVQAVKDGADFHCEASKTGSTTTQKERFTVSWIVNGNTKSPYATEPVVDGNSITQYPSAPSAPSGCHEKVFVGWTNTPINTPTNEAPAILYKQKSDVPAITGNTTLHAVFATAEGGSGNGEEEKKVTLDFTDNSSWNFPTSKTYDSSTYTDANGNSITLGGVTSNGWAWYDNGKYFLYGQSGCYIQFPAFDFIVTKFVTKGRAGASSKVAQNVFVEDEEVSTETTGTTAENTYEINSEYQAAGNVYLLKVTSGHNAQVTQIDIYGITPSITTAYTTLCDECTPSEDLTLKADALTADLDINGEAIITFSTTGGNGGEIVYAANPKAGVTWDNGTATFAKAGDYTITASQEKNGEYCPTTSNTVNVTITAIPHLYFVTDPAPTTIEFDPVECGGNTRVDDKKSVSVQAYNLAAAVTAQVTGPYKIARTSGATLNEYTTSLTLRNNITDGKINGDDDVIYILSFPPAGSSEQTEGTLTFTTTNGNTLTVNLSTPTITCTPRTLTFNDRGIKTTQEYYAGTEVPEPSTPTGVCGEYEFDGWALAKVESGSTTYAKVEFPYIMPANNQTVLHAVYRYLDENSPDTQYQLVTSVESGKDYVLAALTSNKYYALSNSIVEGNSRDEAESIEVAVSNDILTCDNATAVWNIQGNPTAGYTFHNASVNGYLNMLDQEYSSDLSIQADKNNATLFTFEFTGSSLEILAKNHINGCPYLSFNSAVKYYTAFRLSSVPLYLFKQLATTYYTSNPDCNQAVNLTSDGEVYVTATNGRGIMATTPLTLTTTDLSPNTEIAISSNSSDIYFSTERNTNFAMAQASQPKTSLTLTTNEGGELETPLYIHYKPSADGDGTPAEVVVTADVSTHTPPFTAQKTIHVRNLPAKFVIATKAGATWYALPANMNGATNPAAIVIEVDETTMTATAPNTTPYTLYPVATINGATDRYKEYGERLRFAAVNNGNKGLWANNSKEGTDINNYATITATNSTPGAAYEWKVTTTVVDGQWQYTLQTDQANNQQNLCYRMNQENPAWGTYASNEAQYQLYFLPIKAETKPFDYKVVEWFPNKLLIHTTTAFSSLTAKIAGEQVANVQYTSKDANQYEVTGLPLMENPAKALTLEFVVADATHTGIHTIPVMLSRGDHSISALAIEKGIYNYTDLVVRDGATLTIDGATKADNTFYDVTIYPTAKISVPEGKQLSVHRMTFLGGISEIYNGSTYELNKYGVPQLSLKGTLGKTVTTMDYIMRVNLEQMYSLGVPYDVNLGEITYWDGSAIELGDELYVSAYDGQARADLDMNNTWRWEVDFVEKVLKAGVGYTISAEPQIVDDTYSILRMPMKSNITSGSTEGEKIVKVVGYANQHDETITDNHKGWNLLSNPYMTAIKGDMGEGLLVVGYLEGTDVITDNYRYVTIPGDNGKWYYQQKFADATLLPFKSFFVQVKEEVKDGTLTFALANRQNASARLLQQDIAPREVEFEVLLSNGKQSDNMGILISKEYTPAYEINADLEKMTGTMSVYTIYNGYTLAYNALSPLNAEEQIPVGYIVPANGEYTFDLKEHGDYDKVEHIYLIDREMDAMVDLLEETYDFYAVEKKNNNRFAISVILKSEQSDGDITTNLGEVDIHSKQPQKFFYDGELYILRDGKVYSATGHEIKTINE